MLINIVYLFNIPQNSIDKSQVYLVSVNIDERQEERMKKSLIIFIKTLFTSNLFAEAYSEPCQTSKMETFAKLHFGCLTGIFGICFCITSTDFQFFIKNVIRIQNQIKCKSINTCTFSLILAQSQILSNHQNNQYQINLRKLTLTSTLLVILEQSKLPLCEKNCIILNSSFFI